MAVFGPPEWFGLAIRLWSPAPGKRASAGNCFRSRKRSARALGAASDPVAWIGLPKPERNSESVVWQVELTGQGLVRDNIGRGYLDPAQTF